MKPLFNTSLILVLLLAACTPQQKFNRARKAEAKGKNYKAWQLYQEYAADYPRHTHAAEALFRAGWLIQKEQGDCYMASTFYDQVLERYPQSTPWARVAVRQKNNCPDFFPLVAGWEWVEGDSETTGKNARIEIVSKKAQRKAGDENLETGILSRTYYAGASKFKTIDYLYKKNSNELAEFESADDPRSKVILKWPLEAGHRWQTKYGGRIYQYEIVSVNAPVKVAAGDFKDCLHVRSTVEGTTGATNEYYAPSVGRVLATISTKDGERRNTELLSYKPPASVEWNFDEAQP